MTWDFPSFAWIFLFGGLLCLALGGAALHRRQSPGAIPFALFTFTVAVWLFGRVLEAGAVEFSAKVLWGRIEWFGIPFTGVLWLIFALEYAGYHWWKRPRNLILLWVLPVVSIAMVWTNDWHRLLWPNILPSPGTGGAILEWQHGPWFWLMWAFNAITILAGVATFMRLFAGHGGAYRRRLIALIVGTLIPIAANVVYVFGFSPVRGLDLTPFAFAIAACVYAVTLFWFGFFDIVPVARHTLVEKMSDGIVVLDAESRIVDVNPAALAILQTNATQAIGRQLADVWLEWKNVAGNDRHLETKIQERWLDIDVAPIRDPGGRETGRLVVMRDTTERNQTQAELKALYERERSLRQDLEAEIGKRTVYTRALVHELRTPLTAVIAAAELLEAEEKNPSLAALARTVTNSAASLNRRIGELVELARGETGMLKAYPEPADIAALLADIVNEMAPVASGKGLSLALKTATPLPAVMIDEDRIRQVMANLLSNAFKYAGSGEVVVRASPEGNGNVLVQVQDSGRGMDEEQLQHLFDPYWRKAQNREAFDGMGIGLSLSKILVELHGGRIWAESTPGKGTVLSFTVPVARESV